MPASFFDVDGTLAHTNLIHPTLFYLANQQSPLASLGALARAALGGPRMVLAEAVNRGRFNELLYAAYKGISRDRLVVLSREAFESVTKPALYPGARSMVARSLSEGHDVVLVSGALDFSIMPLKSYLGAVDAICNRLVFKDGYATGKLLRPVVAGPEKARLIREWAKAHGHDLADCFAYSDSSSDVPMLSVVGHPCAVNPDHRLSSLARTYAWPVVHLTRHPEVGYSRAAGPRAALRGLTDRFS